MAMTRLVLRCFVALALCGVAWVARQRAGAVGQPVTAHTFSVVRSEI